MLTVLSTNVFVLLLLSWSTEHNEAVPAEFTSPESCAAVAAQAKRTCNGWGASVYAVCAET